LSDLKGNADQPNARDIPGGVIPRPSRSRRAQSPSQRLAVVALGLLLLALPRLLHGNLWIRVLDQAGIGVMLAVGLDVMAGQVGLVSLGYAAFYAVGAYTYALLASPQLDIHLPFALLFPLAGGLAALAGVLISLPALSLRGDYLAMVTLAFGEIVRLLLNTVHFTGGPQGIISIDQPRFLTATLTTPRDYYYFILAACAVEMFLFSRIEKSRVGRAWRAIREDEAAARTMGVPANRLKVLACAVAAVPAGLAGVLFAGLQTFVSPVSFALVESVGILAMVVAGGMGNIPGAAVGAVAITLITEPLRQYTGEYRLLIYGILLMVFALFRPQGIWPKRRRASRKSFDAEASSNPPTTEV
jgi:branched-chain amino acid transport system permease protein